MRFVIGFTVGLLLIGLSSAQAQAPRFPAPPPASAKFVEVPATPDEPLAKEFSLENAARALDAGSINFAQQHRCVQCHANLMYAVARPLLASVLEPPPDMRTFLEWIVTERWPKTVVYDYIGPDHPARKGHGEQKIATEPIAIAIQLSSSDRAVGKLHPATKRALEEVISRQRPDDGGFNYVRDGSADFMEEFDQTMLAAVAVAAAPEKFAETEAAKKMLDGVRKYVKEHPAKLPYQLGTRLWAAAHIADLQTDEERRSAVERLLSLQQADGGWSLARLLSDNEKAKTGQFAAGLPSDGYGTGFVLFVARQSGIAADDGRLREGVNWLKKNQRESGRWFVKSLANRPGNLISNAGTAWAVLGLAACGEVPSSKRVSLRADDGAANDIASRDLKELDLSTEDWPQFRGPGGQGHATARGLPLTWSETENVAWKVAIPGKAWSSPVIRGDRLWLTTATDEGRSLRAICLDRATGNVRLDVAVFPKNEPSGLHDLNSHASPTPILDGDRVFVHFGANGTACLSSEGETLWTTKLTYKTYYGPSSTPVLYKELLIVTCQGTDARFTVALDKHTGQELWRRTHQGRNSEATPLLIPTPTGDQLVGNFADRVVAYDPATGEELWSVSQGNNYAQVPRPVYGHGLVFVCGGYFEPLVQAIRPDGRGDVTKTHVAWSHAQSIPQNPSPILVGDELYLVTDKGVASCFDARTGKLHWRERLGGGFYASPIFADDRLYFCGDDGVTTVIAPGPEFRKLATNSLEKRIMASPAAVGRELYLRTESHLYRLEQR